MTIKAISGFSLGPVFSAAIAFVTVPILTRLLAPQIYAQVSLAQVTTQILLVVSLAGFDQGFVREFYENVSKAKLLFHTLAFNIIIVSLVILIIVLFLKPISIFLFLEYDLISMLLICATLVALIFKRYVQLALRMKGDALPYSLTMVIQASFNLAFVVIFLKFNLLAQLQSVLLANLLSIIAAILLGALKLRVRHDNLYADGLDLKLFKKLAAYSTPLLVAAIFTWVLSSADQYMLKILTDYEQLGLYAVAYKLCGALILFQVVLSVYWIPLSLKWAQDNVDLANFEKFGFRVSCMLIVMFLIMILFKDLLAPLLGNEYIEAVQIFPYLLMYPIYYTLSEVGSIGIAISRKTIILMPITLSCAILNIAMNIYIIPLLGAKGAAISTAVTFAIYFYLRAFFSNRLWKKMAWESYNYLTAISFLTLVSMELNASPYVSLFCLVAVLSVFFRKEDGLVKLVKDRLG